MVRLIWAEQNYTKKYMAIAQEPEPVISGIGGLFRSKQESDVDTWHLLQSRRIKTV